MEVAKTALHKHFEVNMSEKGKQIILTGDQYISLLEQKKIIFRHTKTPQEIEAEKLMQRCLDAVVRGEKFC